ncbi:hypothetical protein [Arenibaculum pallidiluteum]|uniref:hypothetical protein n=1 Tax=Arenibaculum pallidiluteum TaxID=2812559 RepID=UPI001F42E0DE|nr:hypothetical protein [Arenibaculum pallidiluteum]
MDGRSKAEINALGDHATRVANKDAEIVMDMSRKLSRDIATLEKRFHAVRIETFPAYKEARAAYLDIQGLVDTIQERGARVPKLLPPNFTQWVLRAKLKALSIFTDISHAFISDPPITLTKSFGAFDVLKSEHANFSEVLGYFDMMLMEAGIDDKTSEILDATRTRIEEILQMIDRLLETSPPPLTEFD